MATFITEAVLREALNSANQHAANPLPAHWESLIPLANQRGYNRIQSLFLGRGFSTTQFTAWGTGSTSHGVDWNKRYSVVFAFLEASKTDPDKSRIFREELKELDEEFKMLAIIIDGALAPSGRITTGDMDTNSDRFLLDEPDGSGDFTVPSNGTTL